MLLCRTTQPCKFLGMDENNTCHILSGAVINPYHRPLNASILFH